MAKGDVLAGKYVVDRVLAAGGMGVVVVAEHVDLHRRVALKFLHRGAQGHGAIERFLREARAAAQLESVHVARTLDTGKLDDGSPYIVMELLEGRDLEEELRSRAALALEDVALYLLHACDALAEAHRLGIVHRDLKPSNLFLTKGPDGAPRVKVLDFGISKLAPLGDGGGALTSAESVFGSPAYMSPEQMRSARDVDERADIWSLGVVLYELLTGRLPFEGRSAVEIALCVAQKEPPALRGLRPELPEGVDAIVTRCLAKDARDRFADVAELARALAPFAREIDRAHADRIAAIRHPHTREPTRGGGGVAPSVGAYATTVAAPAERAVTTEPRGGAHPRLFLAGGALGGLLLVAAVSFGVRRATLPSERPVERAPPRQEAEGAEDPPPAVAPTTPPPALAVSAEGEAPAADLRPRSRAPARGGLTRPPRTAAPPTQAPNAAPSAEPPLPADAGRYWRTRE